MGYEYSLRFEHADAESVAALLRQLPHVRESPNDKLEFEARKDDNPGAIPNVSMRVQPDGLYFCDYGGSWEAFGLVIARLVARFGPVTIQELE